MKEIYLFFAIELLSIHIYSQSMAGVTNLKDTSYSNHSAYINSKKEYPEIKLVEEFNFPSVKEKKNIIYCEQGDRKLMLDAFYSTKKNKKRKPAIIIVHGGGWRTGNRTQHYPLAQKLASLGYVCFTPEYRLSTEALYPAGVYDVKASIRWVHQHAKEYNIDTSYIAILGFSAGGELAAFMGSTNDIKKFDGNEECNSDNSSWVHAIIDIDGTLAFVHAESGEGDDSKNISAATYWFGYSKKENPELWKEAGPLTHAGSQNPPTLFLNSSVARMHAGRNDYIAIMNKNKIYTEVHEFENSPHSFCLLEPWFQPTVNYIDLFLKKVFKK